MRCVIVAAGEGTRLRTRGPSKPLIPLRGAPLIEHVIGRGRRAGVTEFLVVSGYRGEELRTALEAVARRRDIAVRHAVNAEWRRGNGVSLLTAKPFLDEPFLLTMCDHLFDPAILTDLMARPAAPGSVTLAVDFKVDDPLHDPDDVTRVRCRDGRITAIGKAIGAFDAVDTGAFLCTPAMFAALETSQAAGDDGISGAMTVLARTGQALVHDIGDRRWLDVDDPVAFGKAEALLASGRF